MRALIDNAQGCHPHGVSERYMIGEEVYQVSVDVDGNSGFSTLRFEGPPKGQRTINARREYPFYLYRLASAIPVAKSWLIYHIALQEGTLEEIQDARKRARSAEFELFPQYFMKQ